MNSISEKAIRGKWGPVRFGKVRLHVTMPSHRMRLRYGSGAEMSGEGACWVPPVSIVASVAILVVLTGVRSGRPDGLRARFGNAIKPKQSR